MKLEPLTQDELEEWAAHPITRRVIAALEATVDSRRTSIMEKLWHTGETDKWFLAKAVAYEQVIDGLKHARAEEVNDWTIGPSAAPEDGAG